MNYKLVIFDWEGTLGDSLGQTMIPGAFECLTYLQELGVTLAVATNKHDHSLQKDINFFGLTSVFQLTRCANQTAPKPDPQMLLEIIEETNIAPENTLMIGDSESDMIMASTIGIKAIGIDLSGQFGALLRTAGACHVVRNYDGLMDYLKQRNVEN